MFDATEHLVEQVGHALVVEIHLYHLAQVGIHQLHHQIPTTDHHVKEHLYYYEDRKAVGDRR